MAEYPALPLFTDAYMADTRHLTTAQHGAYLLLLMTAWRMPDCKLPDDDKLLARWAGLDYRNWCKMRPYIIDQFWQKDVDGKLYQGRLQDERKYADTRRQKNAEAGRASALKYKERHSTTVATKPQPNDNPHTLPTPTIKDNTIEVLSKKVSLEQLSTSHVAEWLNQKRALGKYLMHDENFVLEQFKQYCTAKGKKYANYISAYQNAFEWDKCQPTKQRRGDPATNAFNAAQSIIARRNAAAGINTAPESAYDAFAAGVCLPENIRG